MSKKLNYNWKIKYLNAFNYELNVSFELENNLVKHIFDKSLEKLKQSNNDIDLNLVKRFDIPKKYYQSLKPIGNVIIKDLNNIILAKGFFIYSFEVKESFWEKTPDDLKKWIVNITYNGTYINK